jgi:hypothetical protein
MVGKIRVFEVTCECSHNHLGAKNVTKRKCDQCACTRYREVEVKAHRPEEPMSDQVESVCYHTYNMAGVCINCGRDIANEAADHLFCRPEDDTRLVGALRARIAQLEAQLAEMGTVNEWRRMCRTECKDCCALQRAARKVEGVNCFRHPDDLGPLRRRAQVNTQEPK